MGDAWGLPFPGHCYREAAEAEKLMAAEADDCRDSWRSLWADVTWSWDLTRDGGYQEVAQDFGVRKPPTE